MVIWFRHGSCTVGVEDGWVRADDFAALTTLLQAAGSVEQERQDVLAQARQEIDAERAAARQEIEATRALARDELERGYRDGMERGREEAATQWAATALREAASTQRSLERQTQRLTHIVSLAVERVVEMEDRPALYRRALRTITKLLKDVPLLTLRVPPADGETAQRAVDAVLQQLGHALPIEVVSDAALSQGSCLFESDQGVIDAGLDTQLAAIKRAVVRAARQLAQDTLASPAGDELRGDAGLLDDTAVPLELQDDDPAALAWPPLH